MYPSDYFVHHFFCLAAIDILEEPKTAASCSCSTTIPDLASEAAAFFTQFNLPETNDLYLINFSGAGTPYVDFHGFRVPQEYITHLEAVYNNRRDFM